MAYDYHDLVSAGVLHGTCFSVFVKEMVYEAFRGAFTLSDVSYKNGTLLNLLRALQIR